MTAPGSSSGYRPSPRPSFSSATVIPRSQAVRHVWGDSESGEVLDRIYVSNDKIHQLLFEIPAQGQFTHSPEFRTVFGADEVLYAVDGHLVVANPETGQVVRLSPGEAVFFGPGTWHHAFNWGTGPVQVLEYFAPPPATGTSGVYARQQPLLTGSKYSGDGLLGSVVPGAEPDAPRATEPRAARSGRLTVIRPQDYLWRLDGDRSPVLSGIIASTPQLAVARCEVRSSTWSGWLSHFGDTGGFVLAGTLLLQPDEGRSWHELCPGDGFYLPGGQRYQVRNAGTDIATYLVGSAPATNTSAAGGQAGFVSGGR